MQNFDSRQFLRYSYASVELFNTFNLGIIQEHLITWFPKIKKTVHFLEKRRVLAIADSIKASIVTFIEWHNCCFCASKMKTISYPSAEIISGLWSIMY